jgi:mannose-1-phosphate guanylyltransferase
VLDSSQAFSSFFFEILSMQALILAGGKGTRLRPLTVYTPKPVVPICNRPFLLYQIDILRRSGITDIILSLSYQPNKIEQQLGDGTDYGVKIRYTVESQPMGTAGAVKYAREHIQESTVIFNGDIFTDLILDAMIKEHRERKAQATIALTPIDNPSSYGVVETETDGRVRRFIEKPQPHEVTANLINAGIYIIEPEVLDLIPANENYSFEYGLFPDLLKREASFYAHIPGNCYWKDIGTASRYLDANLDLINNRVQRIKVKDKRGTFDSATVSEIDEISVIADDCMIKPGAQIVGSVLGQGCYIEEKASVINSVVWPHTRIGAGAQIVNAVIGKGCHIGRSCQVGPGSVLGDKSSLTDYSQSGAQV